MTKEELIQQMEICAGTINGEHPYECPKDCQMRQVDFYTMYIIKDALELLKEQEARVLTVEELTDRLKTPILKETKSSHKDLYNGWVLAYDLQKGQGITTGLRLGMAEPSGRVVWYRMDDYGKTWRCWTKKPTDERKKAVKWYE